MAEEIVQPEVDDTDSKLRRSRVRGKSSGSFDNGKIAKRVCEFASDDEATKAEDYDRRLQRYAKMRMWTDGGDGFPWENSSDVGIPMMMTDCLSMADNLHNAIMSNRPITSSRALQKVDEGNQDLIDDLLDTQIFIEQLGEKVVEESADCFVQDGNFVAFLPWITEERKVWLYQTFDGFGQEMPIVHFRRIMKQEFPNTAIRMLDDEGWDWEVKEKGKDPFEIKFYTDPDTDEIEMTGTKMETVYDGPKIIIKDYEDVLTPIRSANLQPPSPKNPDGAPHVILVDHPTVDEIERLYKSGFYDLIDKKGMDRIKAASQTRAFRHDEAKNQKDSMQGESDSPASSDVSHGRVTLYTCFDLYDIDKSGINTDMIWWVIEETETLIKAKPMTEMYPASPPRRPLAEASFGPVKGRREGIGLLELMESMHDFSKQTMDQMVDTGTMTNMPFGFYRATSGIKPEVMRFWPGDLIPVSDPKNDIYYPQMGSGNATSFGLNMMSIADQMTEKLTVRGDLQLGRVPVGRSSALRTSGNMQALLGQAEARPERILRRFLMGWTEISKQIHELNRAFLSKEKQFRIIGIRDPHGDPYRKIMPGQLKGRYDFDFSINVMNASKMAQQESLEKLMPVYMTELALQLGISTPETIYRMLHDYGKAQGHATGKYINEPNPDASKPPILAEEAIGQILQGIMPVGPPFEGPQGHLDKLQLFMESEHFGLLDTPDSVAMFRAYLSQTSQRLKTEELAKSAANSQQQVGAPTQPGTAPPPGNPPLSGDNELLDETLPSAGGGANAGGLQ